MQNSNNVTKGTCAPLQALFLDRDGVINCERADYVKKWEEMELLPQVLVALQRLAQLPIPIAVLTNQSVIARGLVSAGQVDEIHQRLARLVASHGGRIDAFFVCPHHPDDGCICRKPKPGLLYRAAEYFQVELAHSLFIGDAFSDYQAASAAHCHSLLVTSGLQGDYLRDLLPIHDKVVILPDLFAAVDLVEKTYRPHVYPYGNTNGSNN